MKVLLPDLATAPELADRFLREIKTQASLEHPNIAALHTALRLDNQLVMLMEFVEGVTLEQKLKDGPLPVEQAVDYMSQVLSALDYAHQHGVVHRDIKPANMMLTPGGAVKLMDFGIAKGAGDHRLTMTGTTMGSLYYMSPEQIKGAAHIDSRADIYSAGVSLYELSTGKRPFDGDSQFAIMSAHLEKTPVPPIEIDPRLPQGLNDAILMSVAKDPEMRFQTAGAFRAALSSVLPTKQAPASASVAAVQAAPLEPQPLAAPQPFQPAPLMPAKSSGRRGLWMAAGAIAAALGVVAVIEFGPRKHTEASPPQAAAPKVTTQSPVPEPLPAQVQPSATETSAAPAKSQPAELAVAPPTVRAKPAARPTALQAISSQPAQTPAPQPTQQMQPQQQTTPTQAPVQQAPQPSQQPTQPPAQPAGPSRAEIMASRERFAQLDARASGIRGTLQNLQRSQAASGLNLSSRFTQPASLMDSYMRAASDAIQANDLDSAKDFMTKAERQVETLEKLLNR